MVQKLSTVRQMFAIALLLSAASAVTGLQDVQKPLWPESVPGKKPNIVFFLTDDQDLQMNSLDYMPLLDKHIRAKGTFYKNHFVTTALCCPSRVSLWTGKQAHNTNVTDVNPPYGGYPKFVERGYNENFLPVWLQDSGYDTYYAGKLFNAHTINNYNSPHVKGFNASDFLLDPYTYQYLRPHYQRNHDPPVDYSGENTLDILYRKTIGFLEDALAGDRPFFLGIAPVGPHSNVETEDMNKLGTFSITPPIPAERHKHLFKDAIVPRHPNFNPDEPSGCHWIKDLPKLSESNIEYNDEFYRNRLRALQSIDELVDDVVKLLEKAGVLQDTYIIYTADNGYHISQHRMQPGKETGFEEDIRVPMFIRGPGVPQDRIVDAVTTHIDLAPTIFSMAGLELREDFDGVPVPIIEETMMTAKTRHEHVTVEYWGMAIEEGPKLPKGQSHNVYFNNTYKSLRILSDHYDLYYSVWCTNEHQLYDLKSDPYELHNLYPSTTPSSSVEPQLLGVSLSKVIARLDALLMVTKSCKGITCTQPWKVLHPQGDVNTLYDSLHVDFDAFYEAQVKNEFDHCEFGYLIEAEGPQEALVYTGGVHWSHFV